MLPNGDVFSCPGITDSELRLGNVETDALYDLHENSVNRIYEEIPALQEFCGISVQGRVPKQPYVHTEYELDDYKDGISYCYSADSDMPKNKKEER